MDGGQTWTQLGKAKGEDGADGANGQNGTDGQNGDSFFQGVDVSNPEYVILTLIDGTVIKIPTWSSFEALRNLVNQMNTNLSSLQNIVTALQNNDYVQSVSPYYENGVQVGYILSFTKSGSVIIYHGKDGTDGQDGQNGNDGHSPEIGVRQDTDGQWYWTLDGEWLKDANGAKVRASGIDGQNAIAPQLKIENDYWYISTDNGQTWTQLGKAKGEDGQNGESFFQQVDLSDPSNIVLVLADGTQITLNRFMAVSLHLSIPEEIMICPGEVLQIGYTIEGSISEKTIVTASSDGNYRVRISKESSTSGSIYVTCPEEYVDGYINVLLSDGYGNTEIQVLNFYERRLLLAEGLDYTISSSGGMLYIPVQYNFDYVLQPVGDAGSWISIAQTKAVMRTGEIQLSIAENTMQETRTGQIQINPTIHPDYTFQVINVLQDKIAVPIESIAIEPSSLTLYENNTSLLSATILPENATNKSLSWESSDEAVATVDDSGKVTGVSKGTATITATANDGSGKSASCSVTVKQYVTGITLNKTSLTFYVGNSETLTATVSPDTADDRSVTWSSSNTSVATVTSSGKVTAVAKGTATITVKANDGSGRSASCSVTVKQYVTGITLNKTTLALNVGGSETLTATVSPTTANDRSVTWSSSNTSVATVSSSGKVTAVAKGSATITVKAKDGSGKSASCTVTVKQLVTSITLNKTSISLAIDSYYTLTATVSPTTANDRSVTWSSSNTSIASVTSGGKVHGNAVGTATITVKANDGSGKSASCTVKTYYSGDDPREW